MRAHRLVSLGCRALLQQRTVASIEAAAALGAQVDRIPQGEQDAGRAWALLSFLGVSTAIGASLLPDAAQAEAAKPDIVPADPYARPAELKGLPKDIIMYQYEVCPYCNKVKAFLDFHKLPYRTIEVSPITKAELKWSEHRKVPLVLLDEEALADSTAIISRLAAELQQQQQRQQGKPAESRGWFSRASKSEPVGTPADVDEEERWRRWVDDRLVKVVTVNIYRNMGESFQTFNYINDTGKFGAFEGPVTRTSGAVIMWFIARRLVKKYGITTDLRQELYTTASEWVDALGQKRFLGGEQPNLADLSAFGIIRSITGTDTFMDLMHQTRISDWYEHMMEAVGDTARLSAT